MCSVIKIILIFIATVPDSSEVKRLSFKFRELAKISTYTPPNKEWVSAFKVLDTLMSYEEEAIPLIIGFLDNMEQKDGRFLKVHLKTELKNNPDFGVIFVGPFIELLKNLPVKKLDDYLELFTVIKSIKSIPFLKEQIDRGNFYAFNVLIKMENPEAESTAVEVLRNRDKSEFWGELLNNLPSLHPISLSILKTLKNILNWIESPVDAKVKAAELLAINKEIEGIDWLLRRVSYKSELINCSEKIIPFKFTTSRFHLNYFQYYLSYLGDPNLNLRRKVFLNIRSMHSTSIQNFIQNFKDDFQKEIRDYIPVDERIYTEPKDSLIIPIPPFWKDTIPISKNIFACCKNPFKRGGLFLISSDSIFEFLNGKITNVYEVNDVPLFLSFSPLNDEIIFNYGWENLLWSQKGREIIKSFPKKLDGNIKSIVTNKQGIFVTTENNLYFFDYSGNSLAEIRIKNCRLFKQSTDEDMIGWKRDKLIFFNYFEKFNNLGVQEIQLKGNYITISDINEDGKSDIITIDGDKILLSTYQQNEEKIMNKLNYNAEEVKEIEFADVNGDGKREIVILTMLNKIFIYDLVKNQTFPETDLFPGNGFHIFPIKYYDKEKVFITGTDKGCRPIIFEFDTRKVTYLPILPEKIFPEYVGDDIYSLLLFTPYMGYLYRVEYSILQK